MIKSGMFNILSDFLLFKKYYVNLRSTENHVFAQMHLIH